jgi:hypothetical protein
VKAHDPTPVDWLAGPLLVLVILALMGLLDHLDREAFKEEMRAHVITRPASEIASDAGLVPCRTPATGERLIVENGDCTYIKFASGRKRGG